MTEGGKTIRAAVGDVPSSPFSALRALLEPHEQDAADGIHKLAAALDGLGAPVRLHIRVLDGETVDHFDVAAGTPNPAVHRRAPQSADVTLVVRRATWLRIAHGRLSPFDALLSGRLRVGGDTAIAKRIAQHLSDPAMPFVGLC